MNHIISLFVAIFFLINTAYSDDNFKLVYYCDANNSSIYIDKSIVSPLPTQGHFKKLIIDWGSLVRYSKEKKDRYGDPLRAGSKVINHTCGDIKINISFGYLNEDCQGELGGIEFPVIEVRRNENIILSKIALGECSTRIDRFGPCPGSWAQSVLIEPQLNEQIKLTIKHLYD